MARTLCVRSARKAGHACEPSLATLPESNEGASRTPVEAAIACLVRTSGGILDRDGRIGLGKADDEERACFVVLGRSHDPD